MPHGKYKNEFRTEKANMGQVAWMDWKRITYFGVDIS
jgi:hypothetical protein